MDRLLSTILMVAAATVAACGHDGAGDRDPIDAGPTGDGFRIQVPEIDILPGQEITYCYYTTFPTARSLGVKRWSSAMTPGSHHLILFFATGPSKPDGTIDQDCGLGGSGAGAPYWVYAAQAATAETVMPPTIGMTVAAGQKVYVQLHYVNVSDQVVKASARVDADVYAPTEAYTPGAAYVTYRAGFSIPARSTGSTTGTCAVPADAKFFAMSTHTHKLGTHAAVRDGAAMVFESADWEHPGAREWSDEPFFSFASGRLTYSCEYDNPRDVTVSEGPSATGNEMCMAIAYFFPATAPKFCFNDTLVN